MIVVAPGVLVALVSGDSTVWRFVSAFDHRETIRQTTERDCRSHHNGNTFCGCGCSGRLRVIDINLPFGARRSRFGGQRSQQPILLQCHHLLLSSITRKGVRHTPVSIVNADTSDTP